MTNSNQRGTTGRSLVVLRDDAVAEGVQMLSEMTGTRSVNDIITFENLGVAIVNAPPEQLTVSTRSLDNSPFLIVEPEGYLHAIVDAANQTSATRSVNAQTKFDESKLTWGLQATKVSELDSSVNGSGIKVAILDTGLDLKHPDFQGRSINTKSFVPGEEVQDGNSHGTHCAGTACGSLNPTQLPRYGVAYEAEIYVGKVLNNRGSGEDGWILQAMEWAITNGCHVISMSLGAEVEPGQPFSRVYETVAKRALNRGTLIIAAAGNSSQRSQGKIAPVGMPANSPSIMAVAALDSNLGIADFSCGGISPGRGGQVDIAAPGVDVYSSVPMSKKYDRYNGTSMATPHVAGIAALYAQVTGLKGRELWTALIQNAQRLPLNSQDVGIGLVQAPIFD
ncbi:MAG: S8 family serine peptidase [Scytonematopsis contorta HA4267-MV1]|jgi:subtilisin family serine protease|nr:S8 family serine peptidase [Scytonematopsis contorta HA4267-MV1]